MLSNGGLCLTILTNMQALSVGLEPAVLRRGVPPAGQPERNKTLNVEYFGRLDYDKPRRVNSADASWDQQHLRVGQRKSCLVDRDSGCPVPVQVETRYPRMGGKITLHG